jgi:hypothetical protein
VCVCVYNHDLEKSRQIAQEFISHERRITVV